MRRGGQATLGASASIQHFLMDRGTDIPLWGLSRSSPHLSELRDPYKREGKAEPGMGPGLASGEAGSPGGAGGGHFSEPFQSQG